MLEMTCNLYTDGFFSDACTGDVGLLHRDASVRLEVGCDTWFDEASASVGSGCRLHSGGYTAFLSVSQDTCLLCLHHPSILRRYGPIGEFAGYLKNVAVFDRLLWPLWLLLLAHISVLWTVVCGEIEV